MRNRHLVNVIVACGLFSCDAAIAPETHNGDLEVPSACDASLPPMITWTGKPVLAPLVPPQTDESTVLIFENPEDPNGFWAFSTDQGKITTWLAFPRSLLGNLIMQIQEPQVQQVAGSYASSGAKTSVVKVRVPKGPRPAMLARDVAFEAKRELLVGVQAQDDSDQCDADKDDK